MNEQNIIIVLGDLGAGSNFVKNILLLSPDVDFPWSTVLPRHDFIASTVYPKLLKTNPEQWIQHEYKLRLWEQYYGVDISDNYADIDTAQVQKISQHRKIVFLCHTPDIVNRIKAQYPGIVVVSLHAATDQGVAWQLSQYISKLGIDRMHNFSFEHDAETQKQQYIQQHGIEQYRQFNSLNALEIMQSRKDNYSRSDYITICIEHLLDNKWIPDLVNEIGIDINLSNAFTLANTWRNTNPPFKQYWKISTNDTN